MEIDRFSDFSIKNIDSPFTELFSLLKRFETQPNGQSIADFNSEELKVIHQHIDNAIEILLQGLQDLGQLMCLAAQDNEMIEELNNIGSFISAISNLTEALNVLRLDTNHILNEREMQ